MAGEGPSLGEDPLLCRGPCPLVSLPLLSFSPRPRKDKAPGLASSRVHLEVQLMPRPVLSHRPSTSSGWSYLLPGVGGATFLVPEGEAPRSCRATAGEGGQCG